MAEHKEYRWTGSTLGRRWLRSIRLTHTKFVLSVGRFLPSGVMFIYQDTLGVSNLSVKFMTRLLENSDVVPAVNQIELHP